MSELSFVAVAVLVVVVVLGLGQFGTARSDSPPAATTPAQAGAPTSAPAFDPPQPCKGFVTDLRAKGYAVLPAPREVELKSGKVTVTGSWEVAFGALQNDIAARTLQGWFKSHGLELKPLPDRQKPAWGSISLAVSPGAVKTGQDPDLDEQAYRLIIDQAQIIVVANGRPGLFYGVQTLLQLMAGDGSHGTVRKGEIILPECVITDWPTYQLRVCHWDTKHHQDRLETLKRYLDQMASFKLNAVSFELEDKFEYPTHPVIGAPAAFTAKEFQELTDYALERHIQLIPNVQAPAHMTYVLKHPEFADLKCDGSNYLACMDDPKVRKLIFEMYDDVCNANKGVKYFHVSTDEVYYAGICEKYRKPYNPTNRSLTWVDFVKAARDHLAKRGRRIMVWAEYPLLPEHIKLLQPDIIDAILGGAAAAVREENAIGMRQFSYVSMQGAELMFPNYFNLADKGSKKARGRIDAARADTLTGKATRGRPIGAFSAAWDDAGLHNETFWLGWGVMAQNSWSPGAAPTEQTVGEFFDIFYGRSAEGMLDVYRELDSQSRFFAGVWENRPSKVRGPSYGNSKGKEAIDRKDMTLDGPSLPQGPELKLTPAAGALAERRKALLADLPARIEQSDRLIGRLQANLGKVEHNRYNVEVLLSIAKFERHLFDLLIDMDKAEALLVKATEAHAAKKPKQALQALSQAQRLMADQVRQRQDVLSKLTLVWEKSRLAKNAPRVADVSSAAPEKKYFHVMDDVKDHFADRRADMTYLTAPEESIGLDAWCEAMGKLITDYSRANNVRLPEEGEVIMDE